jgi:hypothetical protein
MRAARRCRPRLVTKIAENPLKGTPSPGDHLRFNMPSIIRRKRPAMLARDRKTVLDGEIAEPDFWAAVCVSGARLIDDLRDFTDASTLLRLDEPSEV